MELQQPMIQSKKEYQTPSKIYEIKEARTYA